MGARILLISLFLWGWTGPAVCRVLCAQAPAPPATAEPRTAEAVPSGHGGCHGQPAPAAEPGAGQSGDVSESCSCSSPDFAARGQVLDSAERDTAFPASPLAEVVEAPVSRPSVPSPCSTGPPNSPFCRENPPLLT